MFGRITPDDALKEIEIVFLGMRLQDFFQKDVERILGLFEASRDVLQRLRTISENFEKGLQRDRSYLEENSKLLAELLDESTAQERLDEIIELVSRPQVEERPMLDPETLEKQTQDLINGFEHLRADYKAAINRLSLRTAPLRVEDSSAVKDIFRPIWAAMDQMFEETQKLLQQVNRLGEAAANVRASAAEARTSTSAALAALDAQRNAANQGTVHGS